MPEPSPLQRYVIVQRRLDRRVQLRLRAASKEAQRLINEITGSGVGATVERSQLALIRQQLLRVQIEMWGDISGDLTREMREAAHQAALAGNAVDRRLFKGANLPMPEALEASMRAQAQATVDAYLARTESKVPLSRVVYRSRELSRGIVDREVETSILLGRSAKQIALRVAKLIRPDVPGGVSAAAMRLGRTELNNAFHQAQITRHKDNPFVNGQKWNLSGSHPKPDECNDYATGVHFKGGDPGVFKPDEVPAKPHPNCLCYLTAVTISEAEFIEGMTTGRYSSYISSVTKEFSSA